MFCFHVNRIANKKVMSVPTYRLFSLIQLTCWWKPARFSANTDIYSPVSSDISQSMRLWVFLLTLAFCEEMALLPKSGSNNHLAQHTRRYYDKLWLSFSCHLGISGCSTWHLNDLLVFVLGLLCHLDDACTSNPCHADAICDTSPINGSYTCSCASGYKGIDCSEDINECEQGKEITSWNWRQAEELMCGT